MQAIIYLSNTGSTAAYAEMLGKKTGLPVYALADAKKNVGKGAQILYLGWLMGGSIKGYRTARRRYHIAAVCGVGMGATGSQIQQVRKANRLPDTTPVFTLQGGFHMQKLRGVYRFMMRVMAKTAGKALADKPDRTPEEDSMLKLLTEGGSFVREQNLAEVLAWYAQNCRRADLT